MRYRSSPAGPGAVLWLALWVVLAGLLVVPPDAVAQEQEQEQEGEDETYEASEEPFDEADADFFGDESSEDAGVDDQDEEPDETDLEAIEDLLARDESTRSDLDSEGYDAGSRRDPFRSLLQGRDAGTEETKERPEGVAGLLIDEIVVEGVFELADGPVAQVQASHEQTSYLIRPGDQLWDGDVVSISLEEVVFKQLVDDPTALKPFREVVKRLNP